MVAPAQYSQTLPPPSLFASSKETSPPPAFGAAPPQLGAYASKLFDLAAQAEAHIKQSRQAALLPSVMTYAQTEILEPDKVARQFQEMASAPSADAPKKREA